MYKAVYSRNISGHGSSHCRYNNATNSHCDHLYDRRTEIDILFDNHQQNAEHSDRSLLLYVYVCLQFTVYNEQWTVYPYPQSVQCLMYNSYIYLNNQYTSREMCAYKTLMNVYGSFFFHLLVHSHFFICVSLQLLCIKNVVLYFSETFLFNRRIALVAKTCNRYSRCLACPAFCCFFIVFFFFLRCILHWFLCYTFFLQIFILYNKYIFFV